MDFTKATDGQLKVLFGHERNVPKEVMKDIVHEYCNRRMLDGFITFILKKLNMKPSEDLIQIGYLTLWQRMKNYRPTNNVFITYAFLVIKDGFLLYMRDQNAEKRKSEHNKLSLNVELRENDNDATYLDNLYDSRINVEQQVINKLILEDALSKTTDKQLEVLLLYAKGYSIREIGIKILGISPFAVQKRIHLAFKKMNPNRPDISLIDLGLTK